MTARSFPSAHLWRRGDRIACKSRGALADDVAFAKPGWPLCGDYRAGDPREHDGRMYCSKHRAKRRRR